MEFKPKQFLKLQGKPHTFNFDDLFIRLIGYLQMLYADL